ncbi:hypothetical protein B9Z19DRAFT_1069291 [Tuber borchii]|uniref:Uncharacterized protein n=1 Tax=Tuber borchii TaxID=42251 RepID=A0A2T6ZC18_TUBBO|nr:hypothetical protein B9Z19DRAFT_1069291 [Tuber borchii]
MEQDRIPGWKGSTAAQWAAIQAYAIATSSVTDRVALWQANSSRGKHFTECLDFLLKDIAKKHNAILARLLEAAQPVPTVAAPIAAPIAVRNDRLAGPHSVHLWLVQGSVVRPDNPLPPGLDKIQWQTHGHGYRIVMTEPTMDDLFKCINRVLSWEYGYHLLVVATRQGMRMLLVDPEGPLPLAEMITLGNSRHVCIWWSVNSPGELIDLLFYSQCVPDNDGNPSPSAIHFGPHDN